MQSVIIIVFVVLVWLSTFIPRSFFTGQQPPVQSPLPTMSATTPTASPTQVPTAVPTQQIATPTSAPQVRLSIVPVRGRERDEE